MTKLAPHKTLKLIARGTLTFDERVVLYLTEKKCKVALQKSIPAQTHQLILHISNDKGQIDGFVRETTCAGRLDKLSQ